MDPEQSIDNFTMLRTPVLILGYNRPRKLRVLLESVTKMCQNEDRKVYVFLDGPRNNGDIEKVKQVSEVVAAYQQNLFRIVRRTDNVGLSVNVEDAVTTVLDESDTAIVLEDDLIVNQDLLRYFDLCLDYYRENHDVWAISGFTFMDNHGSSDKVFVHKMRDINSWGWATWKSRWSQREALDAHYLKSLSFAEVWDMTHGFRLDYHAMMWNSLHGHIDSWAIKWFKTVYSREGFSIYPSRSLVLNDGFDGSGTHVGMYYQSAGIENIFDDINVVFPEIEYDKVEYLRELKEKNGGQLARLYRFLRYAYRSFMMRLR